LDDYFNEAIVATKRRQIKESKGRGGGSNRLSAEHGMRAWTAVQTCAGPGGIAPGSQALAFILHIQALIAGGSMPGDAG
jgi:hypothetical protein